MDCSLYWQAPEAGGASFGDGDPAAARLLHLRFNGVGIGSDVRSDVAAFDGDAVQLLGGLHIHFWPSILPTATTCSPRLLYSL